MRKFAILTMTLAVVLAAAVPGAIAQDKQDKSKDSKGGLGGVLDTLGNVLGTGPQKLHGTVVVADGSTVVLRTDDARTYRVDTASLDPQKVRSMTPGQTVSVTARGGGQAGVLTASDVMPDAKSNGKTFQTVNGTVQEASRDRVMFKTREGLVLPVDIGNINGLPYLTANQPATLYYEQGPKQEIVGVWIQPGTGQAAHTSRTTGQTSPTTAQTSPSASVPSTQSVDGVVESIAMSELKVRTTDGRALTVDTSGVDRQALRGVAPGDTVTVTGAADTTGDRFVAQSVQPRR
jgi:hypothetical protein